MGKALLVTLLTGGYLTGLVLLIRWSVRRSRRLVDEKARAFSAGLTEGGGRIIRVTPGPSPYVGSEIELELPDGKRVFVSSWFVNRSHTRLNVRIATPPLPAIMLTKETGLARFAKNIGLTGEVQLGDPAFDDQVFIHTAAAPDVVKNLLSAPQVRRMLTRTIEAGFAVSMGERGLEAFAITTASQAPATATIPAIAGALGALEAALPRSDRPVVTSPPAIGPQKGVVLLAVSTALGAMLAGGLAAAVPVATVDTSSNWSAVLWGLCASVSVVAILIALVRGRSNAHTVVLGGGILALIGVTVLGTLGALSVNQLLDDGPVIAWHEAEVLKVHHDEHAHDVRVTSWRGHPHESLEVSHRLIDTLKAGDHVKVRIHPGALGWPWAEVAPPDP